jgi:peptide chain release factor 1
MLSARLAEAARRHDELERLLEGAATSGDPRELERLGREYRRLEEVLTLGRKLAETQRSLADARGELARALDPELKTIAEEEVQRLTEKLHEQEHGLADLLEPEDPEDTKDTVIEIRAGTGGEEAALFAADLFRMYARFAEERTWKATLLSSSRSATGGFTNITFEVRGRRVYKTLKHESGVHRVQRIPTTEKSGRIHTSTATVAVLPEADEVDVKIDPKDVKIETSTARGHGGQSVNTTYSAIRLTHLPTGIVVSCQDERSQTQNRERAFVILRARLFALENTKRRSERDSARRAQIGSGERAEKIRTYNVPQDRVTDHRLKTSFPGVAAVLDGNLDPIVAAFRERAETERRAGAEG